MERESRKKLLLWQERETVLRAWDNLANSGAVVLLEDIFERERGEIGGADFQTFIDTAHPVMLQQYLDAHPGAAPLFVRQAYFQRRPERTAATYQVTYNHRDIINIATRRKTELFDGIAAESDVTGAVTVFQLQQREDRMYVPINITYRSDDKEVLAQRVKEEIERSYRMSKYQPQPRKRR